jgi:arylsulfatase A-like enzyme
VEAHAEGAARGLAVLALGFVCAGAVWLACGGGASRSSVVLISIDTLRRDHLTFYGYDRPTSPRLAELARRGVVFDQSITPHVLTAPAHASMLTGLYSPEHGVLDNRNPLAAGVATLPEILRSSGYETAAFVSGFAMARHTRLERGFDVYDATRSRAHYGVERFERPAEETVDAALRWLEGREDATRPFFLFVHLYDPHYPYEPPPAFARPFLARGTPDRTPQDLPHLKSESGVSAATAAGYVALYDGEIAYADHHAGRLLDALQGLPGADRMLVVFTSDHGETLFEREWAFDHGSRVYDEQALVPLVIRFPADGHAGARIGSPVQATDLLPTVLEVLGIEAPDGVSGRSLVALVREPGRDDERPTFVCGDPRSERVPEVGADLAPGLVTAVRVGGHKLIEYPLPQSRWLPQLFDLEADPGETQALPPESPGAEELRERLAAWRRRTFPPDGLPEPQLSPEVEEGLRELGYVP